MSVDKNSRSYLSDLSSHMQQLRCIRAKASVPFYANLRSSEEEKNEIDNKQDKDSMKESSKKNARQDHLYSQYKATVKLLTESLEEAGKLRAILELSSNPGLYEPILQSEIFRLSRSQSTNSNVSQELIQNVKYRSLILEQENLTTQLIELRSSLEQEKNHRKELEAELIASNQMLQSTQNEFDQFQRKYAQLIDSKDLKSSLNSSINGNSYSQKDHKSSISNQMLAKPPKTDRNVRISNDKKSKKVNKIDEKDDEDLLLELDMSVIDDSKASSSSQSSSPEISNESHNISHNPASVTQHKRQEKKDKKQRTRNINKPNESNPRENADFIPEPPAMFVLTIDLGGGVKDDIIVERISEPLILTFDFIQKHGLSESYFEPLVQRIIAIQMDLADNGEEFPPPPPLSPPLPPSLSPPPPPDDEHYEEYKDSAEDASNASRSNSSSPLLMETLKLESPTGKPSKAAASARNENEKKRTGSGGTSPKTNPKISPKTSPKISTLSTTALDSEAVLESEFNDRVMADYTNMLNELFSSPSKPAPTPGKANKPSSDARNAVEAESIESTIADTIKSPAAKSRMSELFPYSIWSERFDHPDHETAAQQSPKGRSGSGILSPQSSSSLSASSPLTKKSSKMAQIEREANENITPSFISSSSLNKVSEINSHNDSIQSLSPKRAVASAQSQRGSPLLNSRMKDLFPMPRDASLPANLADSINKRETLRDSQINTSSRKAVGALKIGPDLYNFDSSSDDEDLDLDESYQSNQMSDSPINRSGSMTSPSQTFLGNSFSRASPSKQTVTEDTDDGYYSLNVSDSSSSNSSELDQNNNNKKKMPVLRGYSSPMKDRDSNSNSKATFATYSPKSISPNSFSSSPRSPFPSDKSLCKEEIGEVIDVAQDIMQRANDLRQEGAMAHAVPLYQDALKLMELTEFESIEEFREDLATFML